MATKKSPRNKVEQSETPYDLLSVLGEIEKVVKIQSVTLSNESRLSTGLLAVDLLLGKGGITAGMYGFAGPEQSAKTTLAISILANSVNQDVGLRTLWDAEGSSGSSTDYVENIFRGAGVKASAGNIFGIKKNGHFTEKPLVYYRDEGSLDTFFNWSSALLRRLPDKRFEDDKWWFVYPNERDLKAKYSSVMDRKMSSENDAIYIPAKDGALQALILCDSWPSLLPDSMDEDSVKTGMALVAREFSKHLPRIVGKLRAKRVALIGINQLREKVGFVMGCFNYGAKVLLADGSRMKIGDMVATRHPGPVLSVDEHGNVSAKRVVNWFNNGKTDEWLHVRFGGVSRSSGRTSLRPQAEMRVTPNHLIRMADGSFKAAGKLQVGDEVLSVGYNQMDAYQRQIVMGSILGDGCVTDSKSRRNSTNMQSGYPINPGFAVGHSLDQLPYLKWKHKILKKYVNPVKIGGNWAGFGCKNILREDWFRTCFLETKTVKGEHVCLPHEMRLSNYIRDNIDLLGVAVWIMDDGTKDPVREIRVKVDSYLNQDFRSFLESINKRLGLRLQPGLSRDSGKLPDTWYYFKVDSYSMSKLAPYIPPFFKKMISSIYGKQIGKLVGSWKYVSSPPVPYFSHTAYVTEILRLNEGETRAHAKGMMQARYEDKFDIEVEGNHTYCVDRVFVHNSPHYEPGGAALKFYSSVRLWMNPRSLSGVPFNPKGKGQIEKEPSLDGGEDTYRYVHVKAVKNKMSVPGLETWLRVWISDSKGQARGFCPVWDSFYAMYQSNLLSGKRSAILLNIPALGGPAQKAINWTEFKTLILGSPEDMKPIFTKMGYRPFNLREGLKRMAKSGKLEELFLDKARSSEKPKDEDEDEDKDEHEEV